MLWCVILVALTIGLGRGKESIADLGRDDFPKEFVFGSGTSAYQVEGAVAEDGRSPSVWDTFAHSGYGSGKSNGDIAADGYHKYKEDVKLMKEMGLEGYRFSISWSRLIPNGRGDVNPKGLEYYNNLINELITQGIQPHITLFHYDLPQVLQDEYQGWLDTKIVDDFTAYADVCFREFGNRVSHWTTLNEPNILAILGHDKGIFPPGRCSYPFGNCSSGNSVIEPYIVAHNCLLAHSSVVALYKRKYKVNQKGLVGLNLYIYHLVPQSDSTEDVIAAKRAQDFFVGWFMEPLMNGLYPDAMKNFAGTKIPEFSENQSKQLVGAFDFIGVNYYSTRFVKDNPNNLTEKQRDWFDDMCIVMSETLNSEKDGFETATAYGLQGVLEYLKQAYGDPPIYIHENGFVLPHDVGLDDIPRVEYLNVHIHSLLNALRNVSNTWGYFTWSFLDLFELQDGYKTSYGIYYVDFGNKELKRQPKLSARWYSNFLKRRSNVIHKERSSDVVKPTSNTY